MAKIILNHLYKKYENGFEAVKDFQLEIEEKEFIIFVGPSGCGKSTTLRMIAGLEEISQGELLIDGKKMNHVSSSERDMAMVFQNYALYPHMTVRKNIAYSLKIHREKKSVIEQKVKEAAEILGLEEVLDRKPSMLSGGQKQRVAMGRAIVRNPKVFLMDEPLSNLDAKLRGQMRVEIAQLYHRLDSTFIYVTHDQTEAMTLGTRIVVMKDGAIQQVDTPHRLFHYPANRFVAGFIGSPTMNFITGIVRMHGHQIALETDAGELYLPEGKADALWDAEYMGKTVVIGIRPEFVTITTDPELSVHAKGSVDVYEMLGTEAVVYIEEAHTKKKLVAKIDAAEPIQAGTRVGLVFDTRKIHLFNVETGITISN